MMTAASCRGRRKKKQKQPSVLQVRGQMCVQVGEGPGVQVVAIAIVRGTYTRRGCYGHTPNPREAGPVLWHSSSKSAACSTRTDPARITWPGACTTLSRRSRTVPPRPHRWRPWRRTKQRRMQTRLLPTSLLPRPASVTRGGISSARPAFVCFDRFSAVAGGGGGGPCRGNAASLLQSLLSANICCATPLTQPGVKGLRGFRFKGLRA